MDAAKKLARQRLSVLELAEILGNVAEPAGVGASAAASFMSTSGGSRPTAWSG